MSLVVGVMSGASAAVASDSLRVDLAAPASGVTVGFRKHVVVGRRAAGIVGVSDIDGVLLLPWVEQALGSAGALRDFPYALLAASGTELREAYLRWRNHVGSEADPSEFLTVLVMQAGSETRPSEALVSRAALIQDSFTLVSDHIVSGSEAEVVAIGATDDFVVAHTADGQLANRVAKLQRQPTPLPDVTLPSGALTAAQCSGLARDVVAGAIKREGALPRPAYWPPGVPVLGGPIHVSVAS